MRPGPPAQDHEYRFGPFRADLRTGELWRNGNRLRLQEQPFQVLAALLAHPGEMVSREELQNRLWPSETFVDFDRGLNVAINKLRDALHDSPERPRYIETLASRGYRFIAPVEVVNSRVAVHGALVPVPATVESAPTLAFARRKWLLAGVMLGIVAVAGGIYTWLSRPPPLNFPKRGWVLIAKFENRTGEALFDDTVEYALERELSNSQFVNLVSPERVQDVFLLMKKPSNTRVDASLAREVALRDGNVQVVLTGRTEKLGARYVLSASLIQPSSGATLRSFAEEVTDQNAVLAAVNRLSRRLQESLGAELPPRGHVPELEKATTPSLRALQLYSQGMAFGNQHNWSAAAQLFEQALAEHPDFASAHIYLAHSYSNLGRDKEAAPHYEAALRLADTVTDRERYFILGTIYERFVEDHEKAIQSYEVLVRLYPDHYWAVNNLALTLDYVGRTSEAVPYYVALAELRPNDFALSYRAWRALRKFNRDPAEVERWLGRVRRMAAGPGIRFEFPGEWIALQFSPVDERLRRGEMEKALEETERLARTLGVQSGDENSELNDVFGDYYEELGRLHEAETYNQKLGAGSPSRYLRLIDLADLRGDDKVMRDQLQELIALKERVGPVTASRLARVGLFSDSEKLISSLASRGFSPCSVQYAKGELALARGETLKAVRLLQDSFEFCWESRDRYALSAGRALAHALVRQGHVPEAIRVLERATSKHVDFKPDRLLPRLKYQLFQLYRSQGREDDARRTEAEIRALLAVADADHPVLVALNREPPKPPRSRQ